MHDNRTHPLLQQLPLTVSPFVNLPTATTLPYTYKPMPSTLPPSAAGITASSSPATTSDPSNPSTSTPPPANTTNNNNNNNKPKYVISPSGHAAHPDEILASCRALHAHVAQLQARAEAELVAVEERIQARELAEKRRVAPGWLDSEARLLEPERKASASGGGGGSGRRDGDGEGEDGEGEDGDGDEGRRWEGGDQQQRQQAGSGFGGYGHGYGQRDGFAQDGHGPGGESEMAVPDEGEELDRAFGSLQVGGRP